MYSAPLDRVPLNLPTTDRLQLSDTKWILVTPDNAEKIWSDLEKKKYDIVIFGLTDKGYEDLSVNVAKLKKLVQQQQSVIAAYKRYYEDQTKAIDESNQKTESIKKDAEKTNKAEADKKSIFNLKGLFK
mgnify:CR=1 FL=1